VVVLAQATMIQTITFWRLARCSIAIRRCWRSLPTWIKDDPLAVLIKRSWDELTYKLNAELKEAENHLAKEQKERNKTNETE
jgi:hypothetical protein